MFITLISVVPCWYCLISQAPPANDLHHVSAIETPAIEDLRSHGHELFARGRFAESELVFNSMLESARSERNLADASRMLAQISIANSTDLAKIVSRCERAWEHAKLDDPSGKFLSTRSVLATLCTYTNLNKQYDDTLRYAQEGVERFQWDARDKFIYESYQANKALGNREAALTALRSLIDVYLPYTKDQNWINSLPVLRLDVYELQDKGWSQPSDAFLAEAESICHDPEYLFATTRLVIASKLAKLYESQGREEVAIEFRAEMREALENELAGFRMQNPVFANLLQDQCAALALDDARLLSRIGLYAKALTILDKAKVEDTTQMPDLAQQARSLRAQIQTKLLRVP